MNRETIRDEILGLEKRYWQAMKDRNLQGALEMTRFPCFVSGESGISQVTRDNFIEIMKTSPYRVEDYQLVDPKIEVLNPEMAIIGYELREKIITQGGKEENVKSYDTSTWVHEHGRWLCAQHSEVKASKNLC